MATDDQLRAGFINSTLALLKHYGFDGLGKNFLLRHLGIVELREEADLSSLEILTFKTFTR